MENELLQKIMKLEENQAQLKQEISKLTISGGHAKSYGGGFDAVKLTESSFVNILQSMGQSVHMFDLNDRIIYWNQMAQNLYGYTVTEALGKTAPDIIIGSKYSALATLIIQRAAKGESWSGEFPVRNRNAERFTVITTLTPSRDENGRINGVLCVCADARPFHELKSQASVSPPWEVSLPEAELDSQQPLQNVIVSKISNLASKIKSKIKAGENKNNMNDYSDFAPVDHRQNASSYSTNEHITKKPSKDSGLGSENKPGIHKVLSSKAEAWIGKNKISWPWKGNENENDQEQKNKVESQHYERSCGSANEAPWSWSSSCGASSSGSTNCNYINKIDIDIDNLDVEVSWDDLIVGDQIGQGSYGTVYHALWSGSEVAVKVFTEQEYPDDVILYFKKEVSLMKRLRHPNILLFMGAVTSPHHLCIVTEFLPRGSLFGLLQLSTTKLDWRRRIHMAMDIARGMNYLHRCQPPIIHRDLKSSNLLVDKNWTVKVGDFGLSRIKCETYLTTMTGKGTPQWMAPEVLRNQQADEKSDVYSYGVVLWEITTGKFPWDNLNSMQVIGAVGFMNQRLEIPNDVDPQWASLIECCWSSEPESRPTFQEILTKLKDLQKKFAVTHRYNRA